MKLLLPVSGLFYLVLSGTIVLGQSTTSPPDYKLLRADEDYRYLAHDSTVQADFFDPVKFIPLSASRQSYLTIGGEIRQQYEWLNNPEWGEGGQHRGYLLQRYMLHTDWHFGTRFRVFGQLKSGLAGKPNPGPADEDQLDVHQAFADWVVSLPANHSLTLRLGRQELNYGSSRLVSVREGPTVRQSFDGGRVMWRSPDLRLDGFVTRPATSKPGIFDDATSAAVWFWGAYAVLPRPKLASGLDVYYLGFVNEKARFARGAGLERRHSVGVRWWSSSGAFQYNAEVVYQFGRFGSGTIRAWTASGEVGYTLKSLPMRPRISLRTEFISGDRDLNSMTLGTFNPLFPKGAYFGQVALIGPANLVDIHPIISARPFPERNLTFTLDWDFFWRASKADGLYTVPYVLTRPGNDTQSAYIGDQITLEGEWLISRHWAAELFLTYFQAGAYLRESGTGLNLTFVSPRLTFLF